MADFSIIVNEIEDPELTDPFSASVDNPNYRITILSVQVNLYFTNFIYGNTSLMLRFITLNKGTQKRQKDGRQLEDGAIATAFYFVDFFGIP